MRGPTRAEWGYQRRRGGATPCANLVRCESTRGTCETMQWGKTESSVEANEVARRGARSFYAVAGGPYTGVHVTDNYDATVRSVVDGFSGARAWGSGAGVYDEASAVRCLSSGAGEAAARGEAAPVVVWVRSAAGYVGRQGHSRGPVVISPSRQLGALPPAMLVVRASRL